MDDATGRRGAPPSTDPGTPRRPGAPPGEVHAPLPAFDDVGELGQGGMSEVRRARDPVLRRTFALKLLAEEEDGNPDALARFIAEAQVTAQLQHPGIVPVYALGRTPEGRLGYAMMEVRGQTLQAVIQALHAASEGGAWGQADGWTFRRLIDAFHRACEAMAYAHSQGVIHRDLKPQNIMVGAFGEVQVLDWGLARLGEQGPSRPSTIRQDDLRYQSMSGSISGTPAYMSPEAAQALDPVGPASDVFCLGATLYEILCGRPPYRGRNIWEVLAQAAEGAWPPPEPPGPVPDALLELLGRAMHPDAAQRLPDAGALASGLAAWLEGARAREQATALVAEADALHLAARACRAEAEAARASAIALLAPVSPHAPVAQKLPGWTAEDRAEALELEAEALELTWVQRLHAALNLSADLPEAHARLAQHYQIEHREAEARRDARAAARAEALLRAHDRGHYAGWLRGEGALTLRTDPPGALATLYRYERQQRRLEPVLVEVLGPTPIHERRLPRGSYLVVLEAPGHAPVRYPVLIEREAPWDGVPPGAGEPLPIALPRVEDLGPDDVYVPAGWAWTGGDPEAADSLPRRRLWLDAFVIRRFPVQQADYLAFLDALAASGRGAEAIARAPRRTGARPNDGPLWSPDASGAWQPPTSGVAPVWGPGRPMVFVSRDDALAYAAHASAPGGPSWRLPHELEREKAGRGVDGRFLPWGDHFDPTWAAVLPSHVGRPALPETQAFATDLSPYGVRGLVGGVCDWCWNAYRREGWPEGSAVPLTAPPEGAPVAVRGGWWGGQPRTARLASRLGGPAGERFDGVGIRLCRSWTAPADP